MTLRALGEDDTGAQLLCIALSVGSCAGQSSARIAVRP